MSLCFWCQDVAPLDLLGLNTYRILQRVPRAVSIGIEILYPKFAYSPLPQNIKISGHARKAYLFGPNNDKAKNLTIFERDMQKVTWVKTPQNRTSAIKAIKDNHISI